MRIVLIYILAAVLFAAVFLILKSSPTLVNKINPGPTVSCGACELGGTR